MRGWKTLRVVIEVPVQGKYSEKDLVWEVRRILDGAGNPLDRKVIGQGVQTGLIQIKQMNMVLANTGRVKARQALAERHAEKAR